MIDRFVAILVFAQASGKKTVMSPDELREEILIWLGVTVLLGVVTGLFGYWLYRKYKHHNAAPPADATYSLGEMRRLYDDGEISHDEYTTVRAKLLAAAKAVTAGHAASQREVIVSPAANPPSPAPQTGAPPQTGASDSTAPPPPAISPKDTSHDDEEPII